MKLRCSLLVALLFLSGCDHNKPVSQAQSEAGKASVAQDDSDLTGLPPKSQPAKVAPQASPTQPVAQAQSPAPAASVPPPVQEETPAPAPVSSASSKGPRLASTASSRASTTNQPDMGLPTNPTAPVASAPAETPPPIAVAPAVTETVSTPPPAEHPLPPRATSDVTIQPPPAPVSAPAPAPVETVNNAASSVDDVPVADQVVVLTTSFGKIVIELDNAAAPITCENFRKLVSDGFYNRTTFHRVIPDFIIQGGDPNSLGSDRSKYGLGGPTYKLPAEIKLSHDVGAVAMARLPDSVNPQRKSNGSQFYICLAACPSLDAKYTVFGHVIKGMDVADKIASQPRDSRDNPLDRIEMQATLEPKNKALANDGDSSP